MNVSGETQMLHVKRRYVRGGSTVCCRAGCQAQRLSYHRYCREHKNEAGRIWAREQMKIARAARARGEGVKG